MKLEEISSNLKPLALIPDNIRSWLDINDGADISNPFIYVFQPEENEIQVTGLTSRPTSLWNDLKLELLNNPVNKKLYFRPECVPNNIISWLLSNPKSHITKNLIFSWCSVHISKEAETTTEIIEELSNQDNIIKAVDYLIERTPVFRINRPRVPSDRTQFDVDMVFEESGSCSYRCNVYYNTVSIANSDLDEIRSIHERDPDEAMDHLTDIVRSSLSYNGASDYDNYTYDDEEAEDDELYEDNTDLQQLLRDIVER